MVGVITKSLKNKIFEVVQFGKDRDNGTRESLNQIMILEFPRPGGVLNSNSRQTGINLLIEETECKHLYASKLGKNWDQKNKEEYHHYGFLTHALLHKINSVKYFNGEDIDSRKLIIFSDDCISAIQLIVREEEVGLYVHMRSSDAVNLLPLDVMALTNLLDNVMITHRLSGEDRRVMIHITFGSLHIYSDDLKIAKEVGISTSGEKYNAARRRYL